MASTTTNLNLTKPAQSDAVNIGVINTNMDLIDQAFGALMGRIYPVGAIYISTNSTNPGTLFGGTWVQIKDSFLLAAGDNYTAASTGGSATHQLTEAELPSHSHTPPSSDTSWRFGMIKDISGQSGTTEFTPAADDASKRMYVVASTGGYGDIAIAARTGNTGSGQAFETMPPYLAVYVWKRTA